MVHTIDLEFFLFMVIFFCICAKAAYVQHTRLPQCKTKKGVCFSKPLSYKTINTSSIDRCCLQCTVDPKCTFWVFRSPMNTTINPGCLLKTNGSITERNDPLCTSGTSAINLIPDKNVSTPLYWCTWQAQGRIWMSGANGMSHANTIKYWEARTHKDWMDGSNSSYIFKNNTKGGSIGWAYLFPDARRDLYLMLDNGWQNGSEASSRSLILDTKKYPEFVAPDPTTSLKMLNKRVISEGWRGLGVWVNGGGKISASGFVRLHNAGINLLKFDGGDNHCEMTKLAKQYAPDLIIEHGFCGSSCPLNGYPGDGRLLDSDAIKMANILKCTDLFRSYDTVKVLSVSETLDRQIKMLWHAREMNSTTLKHFGGSGEPTVTGALGGSIQPMRSNLRGLPIPNEFMVYATGPRLRQHREDEITRWVNWAKFAPPFGGGIQRHTDQPDQVKMSTNILFDSWKFTETDDAAVIGHHLINKTVQQGAPSVVTRGGLLLPDVKISNRSEYPPFVIATKYPNGAISITSIGRTIPLPVGFVDTKANVTLQIDSLLSNYTIVGIFGVYEGLCLTFKSIDKTLHPIKASQTIRYQNYRIWGQDLMGTQPAQDISEYVGWENNTMCLSGTIINHVGTQGRSRLDDVSSPGLVLMFLE